MDKGAHGEIWGRPLEQVVGRPHVEASPDLAGQGFEQIFADVLAPGRVASFQELLVRIEQAHQSYQGCFNITYHPIYDGPHHNYRHLVLGHRSDRVSAGPPASAAAR
jgi:hypothetical protein